MDGTAAVLAGNTAGRQERRSRLWKQWAVQNGICCRCPTKVPLLDARFLNPKEPDLMACKRCQERFLRLEAPHSRPGVDAIELPNEADYA